MELQKIPKWITYSELYSTLKENDMKSMENIENIPDILLKNCNIKDTDDINSFEDFIKILEIYQFWDLYQIPNNIYIYIIKNSLNELQSSILTDNFSILSPLFQFIFLYKNNKYDLAVKVIHIELFGIEIARFLLLYDVYNLSKELKQKHNLCSVMIDINSIEGLYFLINHGYKLNYSLYIMAVKNNNLTIIEFLYRKKCPWNSRVFSIAMEVGNIEIINFFLNHGCPNNNIMEYSSIDTLKYLRKHGFNWSHTLYIKAIDKNDILLIEFLVSENCPMNSDILYHATEIGNINLVKYLIRNGCVFNNNIIDATASDKTLELFNFFLNHGINPSISTMYLAIQYNNINMIVTLIRMNMVLNEECYNMAIHYKNIEIIKILNENNCPRGNRCNTLAKLNGFDEYFNLID